LYKRGCIKSVAEKVYRKRLYKGVAGMAVSDGCKKRVV